MSQHPLLKHTKLQQAGVIMLTTFRQYRDLRRQQETANIIRWRFLVLSQL